MMNRKKLSQVVLLSLISCGMVYNSSVQAKEKNMPEYDLEGIVVTATATPVESVMKTDAAVNIITREDIQTKHYKNLQEILENVPGYGGFMAGNGIGFEVSNYTKPYMRGSDKTVVLIDGVKQDFGGRFYSANAVRNVDDIERIEVLKGTASTLYGAEAVGGVINIITRSHYDKPRTRLSVSAGNFSTQNYQIDNSGDDGKSFWSISALKRTQGNYKDGRGIVRPQDADLTEVDLKYGIHLNDTNDLIFKYVNHDQDQTYVEGRGGGYDAPGKGVFRYNTITAIWNSKAADDKWANSLAFYRGSMLNDRSLEPIIVNEPGIDDYKAWSEKSRSETWSLTNRYYNQLTDNNRLSAGAEIYNSSFNGLPSPHGSNLQGKYTLKEKSVYVQDEWNITDKLKFTAGIRYADPDIAESRMLPSFALGYSFSDNAMMYISSKDYMTYPTFSWMHGYTTGANVYKPSPDLKPQTGTTNEIGTKFKFGKSTYFDVAYYDRRQKDSISAVKIGTSDGKDINVYQNIENPLHIKGIETNFVKCFGEHVTATLGYNHLTADRETLISNMARDTFSIDLRYKQRDYNIGISGLGRYDIARSNALYSKDIKLPQPDFWVWNIYGNYKVNRSLKVWARVDNVFDKFYMFTPEWDSKFNEPRYYSKTGRSFLVGAEYNF